MRPGDQKVSPVPDVIIQSRDPSQDEFILVACDGIWDVLTNYEAVQTVAELFREGETDLGLVCEEVRSLERARAGSRPLACAHRGARPRVE
jgi:serine/threonine protein phosphatase PrpC